MIEVFNSQEIFVFLKDYRLKRPSEDRWESIISVMRIWLDGWFSGQTPDFSIQDGPRLDIVIDDEYQIRMFQEGDVLQILCTEEGEEDLNGDKYPGLFS